MKTNTLILACIVSLLAGFGINRVSAQILANDDAGIYTTWLSGTNAGFGFGPWVFYKTNGGTGFAGEFRGNGDPIGSTNGNFWGTYANSSTTAISEEFRAFSNTLPVNATFSIRWHNKGIGNNSYNLGGFALRNGNNTNLQSASTVVLNDGSVFAMYYIGGISDNFRVFDGNGGNPLPISFSAGSSGLTVQFTLLPNNTYNLVVENGAGNTVLFSMFNQPLANGGGTVDSLGLFASDTGGDQDFNDTQIFYGAPQVQNLTPADGSIYVPTDSPLSFAVTSTFSTISSNQIQFILNGAVQTGANWTVLGSGTSSNQVTLDTPLQLNQVYNGTIIATDANNNSSTNTFTFNTWGTSPNNIYIEGGDYNYGAGQWIDNFTTAQPNQNYGQFDLLGTNNVDYFIYNFAYTNNLAPYRANDLPFVEAATDQDHNSFAANGFTPYNVGFNFNGQWEDYTRELSNNVTYAVYARMAGFNANPIMQLARMATAEVSTTNQPGAVLGQFNCPQTGGTQRYTFVPLTDFFSQPVLINFGGTNTFRTTDIGGNSSYNLGYMVLIGVTNSGVLRPYLTSGFPYPGATGVNPLNQVQFAIANRQTSVNPASIQLFINSNNVTGSLTFSNNAAGTIVTYPHGSGNLFPAGPNYAQVIFSDGSVMLTNSWVFTVATLPVLPSAWAVPLSGSFTRGFAEQIAKGDDSATNIDFKPSVARAVAQLNGTLTNSQTLLPYANEALSGGTNIELNTINYAIDSQFGGLFTPTSAFPDIPLGTTNNVAMQVNMFVLLQPGVYNFNVYSDDGFQFTAMDSANTTNIVLGVADFGRAPSGTQFSFIVQTAGLYRMQLIYFKSQQGGGGVELYSASQGNPNILLNYSGDPNAVKVYYQSSVLAQAPVLNIAPSGNNVILTWNNSNYSLESAPLVTGPYVTNLLATSPWPVAIMGSQQYFRLVKTH
jgi:hypothetical protein